MSNHALSGVDGFKGTIQIFKIDPRAIIVVEGWNSRRDFTGEEELRDSIIANGVQMPLIVKKIDGKIHLSNGERRLRATLRAIAEGHNIEMVPAVLERKGVSETESLFASAIADDGKPLEPLEKADLYRRLVAYGVTVKDIAVRMGRSTVTICEYLKLIDAGPELKDEINNKTVSIRSAAKIVTQSEGNPEKQHQGIQKAKAQSKISNTGWNRWGLYHEELSDLGADTKTMTHRPKGKKTLPATEKY